MEDDAKVILFILGILFVLLLVIFIKVIKVNNAVNSFENKDIEMLDYIYQNCMEGNISISSTNGRAVEIRNDRGVCIIETK